jgi:putative membrane protein
MKKFFRSWIINFLSIALALYLLSGLNATGKAGSLLIFALIFGLLNSTIKPLLVLMSMPFIILTVGLFRAIINASMLYITRFFYDGVEIRSFMWAVLGGIVISIFQTIFNELVFDKVNR